MANHHGICTKMIFLIKNNRVQTRWLMPVIPALQEAKVADRKIRRSRPSWPTWNAAPQAHVLRPRRPRRSDCLSLGDRNQLGQYSEILSLLKIKKTGRVWWQAPIIPTTQEAELGESLEPGRQKLLGDSRHRSHTGHQRDSFGRVAVLPVPQHGASRCGVYGTDGLGWSHPHKENSNWKR
ncbi:hypothetical protein AAY473_000737 [Plecturocebus cupreus]